MSKKKKEWRDGITTAQGPASNFALTAITDVSISLSWSGSGILERATLSDYSNATTIYTGATGYTDTGRTQDTTYYYRINSLTKTVKTFTTQYQVVNAYIVANSYVISLDGKIVDDLVVKNAIAINLWAVAPVFFNHHTDGDLNVALINYKNPGTGNATLENTLGTNASYLRRSGFAGSVSGGAYINYNWIPSTQGGAFYTRNDGGIIAYQGTEQTNTSTQWLYGVVSTHRILFTPRIITSQLASFSNNDGGGANIFNGSAIGLYINRRTVSTTKVLVKDGTVLTSSATASTGLPGASVYGLAYNNGGTATNFHPGRIDCFIPYQASLVSDADITTMWTNHRTRVAAISAPIEQWYVANDVTGIMQNMSGVPEQSHLTHIEAVDDADGYYHAIVYKLYPDPNEIQVLQITDLYFNDNLIGSDWIPYASNPVLNKADTLTTTYGEVNNRSRIMCSIDIAGTLYGFYEYPHGGGKTDCWLATSIDNGKTWTDIGRVLQGDGTQPNLPGTPYPRALLYEGGVLYLALSQASSVNQGTARYQVTVWSTATPLVLASWTYGGIIFARNTLAVGEHFSSVECINWEKRGSKYVLYVNDVDSYNRYWRTQSDTILGLYSVNVLGDIWIDDPQPALQDWLTNEAGYSQFNEQLNFGFIYLDPVSNRRHMYYFIRNGTTQTYARRVALLNLED